MTTAQRKTAEKDDPVVSVPDDVATTGSRFKNVRGQGLPVVVPVLKDGDEKDIDGSPLYERKTVPDQGYLPPGVPDSEINNLTALGYIQPAD